MATEFAVVTVILTAKLSLRRCSKLSRLEELLPLFLIAPQPTLAIAISRFESPRQILNLYHLSKECRCRVLTTISKQTCT